MSPDQTEKTVSIALKGESIPKWLTLLVTVGIVITTIAVGYGVTEAKVANAISNDAKQEERLRLVEINQAKIESTLSSMNGTLSRVENRLDDITSVLNGRSQGRSAKAVQGLEK